jgi:hypothetical protein
MNISMLYAQPRITFILFCFWFYFVLFYFVLFLYLTRHHITTPPRHHTHRHIAASCKRYRSCDIFNYAADKNCC